uniref:Uncharacterized protein n=1 Tax=Oryza punctata TaxID=4537 RepID=A0A0E0MHG6_ORYPU
MDGDVGWMDKIRGVPCMEKLRQKHQVGFKKQLLHLLSICAHLLPSRCLRTITAVVGNDEEVPHSHHSSLVSLPPVAGPVMGGRASSSASSPASSTDRGGKGLGRGGSYNHDWRRWGRGGMRWQGSRREPAAEGTIASARSF